MKSRFARIEAASTAAAVAATAIVLAGCGGGAHHATTRSGAARSSNAISFSRCMRTHGFPQFPDVPASGGLPIEHTDNGGVDIIVNGVGQPVNAPALQTALGKCQRYMSDVAGSAVSSSQASRIFQALLVNAECIRSHGVQRFPDPVPPGNGHIGHMSPSARAKAAGINIDSPAFKAAVNTCGQSLRAAINSGH